MKQKPEQTQGEKTRKSEYGSVTMAEYGTGPPLANNYESAPPLIAEYDAVDSKLVE